MSNKTYLSVELGSTRIKAITIDDNFLPVSDGSFGWKSDFRDGIWTYDLADAWKGLKDAISQVENRENVCAMGLSAMMHGYLAFDENWNLLVPFRTWQNTITEEAAAKLSALFNFNIPQRWTIAHLCQAALNGEEHLQKLAHVTTLAGYIHYKLTGVNAVGVGEASGIFPIDSEKLDYNAKMIEQFDSLKLLPKSVREYLPKVMVAGEKAGTLTEEGAALLDNLLPVGIAFCPPEGDAGTGMVATNAVAPKTGNVSAGTSIFLMAVLERPLKNVYPEIDLVTTPSGNQVAMVHGNNCTNDMNAWADVIRESAALFGAEPDTGALFTSLYKKSLEGDPDCGGVLVYNYMAGEAVTHLNEGRPMVIRRPDSKFTLANFVKAQLYSTMAVMRVGLDLMAQENIVLDSLTGHGGLFKTPVVGQRYMAACCRTPVTCMETAGEGGAYGMALLTAYMMNNDDTLEGFLSKKVFANAKSSTIAPSAEDLDGFNAYMEAYRSALAAEKAAVDAL